VHLGRLAAFYPACRQCAHGNDTGTLSPRRVEQLAETKRRGEPRSLFHDEGAGGVYLNDLTPAAARHIAAAFGVVVQQEGRGERGEGRGDREKPTVHHSSFIIPHSSNPSVLLAGDGRPITAELVAAVSDGLRWSGCDVVDIGPATAACLAFAVHHCPAAGGVLVGNPGQEPHRVGLQFWTAGPRPLSAGGTLEPIVQLYQCGVSRPKRSVGAMRRFQADVPYLAALSQHYHALRPLRVVVDSASKPLVEYLKKLAASVACQVILCRTIGRDLPEQVRADAAHFAVRVDGDGETCRVLDGQGCPVPTERLLLLLAPGVASYKDEQPLRALNREPRPVVAPGTATTGRGFMLDAPRTVVLENATPPVVAERLEQRGMHVVMSSPRRAGMAAAMREHGALFGGGPSGRFWYAEAGVPLPDALMTITRLLTLLSRSDEPLSAVLDREETAG
jgi:phosphomannomutase